MTLEDPILTTDELATATHNSPRTYERWRMVGSGPAFVKIGKRVGYRKSAVEAWLKERTRRHTSDAR